MIKVGILAKNDLNDMSIWSGTTATMTNEIKKNNIVIPLIVRQNFMTRACSKLTKIVTHGKYDTNFIIRYFKRINVKKAISSKNFDILFVPAGSDLLGIEAMDSNKKVIYLSDATYSSLLNYYFFNTPTKTIKIRNTEEKNSLDLASKVVLASDWAKKRAIKDYKIDPKKIEVIKFGANMPDKFNFEFKQAKSNINLLCVGVDWNRKGIEIACETVQLLNQRNLQWKFNLTVVGVEKPKNKKFNRCQFIGKLNKNNKNELEKLEQIYLNSDIFILPTKAECAGIVFCEASMFGLPSITYDTGGVPSYVSNGENGYCLSPTATANDFADKIQSILDENELTNLSISARTFYERELNWDKWRMKFNSLLKSLYTNKYSKEF